MDLAMTAHDDSADMSAGRMGLALSAAMTIILWLSITHQSLWIDEAFTAWFAAQSSLQHLIDAALNAKSSEIQMPLYNLYAWAWAKIFGTSEYALRASNIPFALIFTLALGWTSQHIFRRPLYWVVFCLSPFVVYYMNEARPYIPVLGCAAVTTGALLAYFADPARHGKWAPWSCLLALVFACALHMLAAFLVPVVLVYAVLATRERHLDARAVLRDWRRPLLVSLPLLLLLAVYYAWTILTGVGGKRGNPGLGNIAFAIWEFIGLAGLGPPRNVLRAHPNLHTLVPYGPLLALGILACVVALATILARWRGRPGERPSGSLLVSLAAGIMPLLLLSATVRFEFWGRHLAAFFPGLVFAVIQITSHPPARGRLRALDASALVLLVLAWVISDLRIVTDPQYYKDDYRSAAAAALDEAARTNGTVLWVADPMGGRYYGVAMAQLKPDVSRPVRRQGVFAVNWTDAQIGEYMAADSANGRELILVLSKPDLYDKKGAWTAAVRRLHPRRLASVNSFDVYAFK